MAGRRKPNPEAIPRRVLITLLAVSFVLALVDGRSSVSSLNALRESVATAVAPLQQGASNVSQPIIDFFDDWAEVGSKNEVIQKLRLQNEALIREINASEDSARRADELDQLLQIAGQGEFGIVLARVMSIGSASGFGSTILIDAGSDDGIKPNMTVIAGQGMVGRVLSVTSSTSVVILLVDATSTVGARVEKSGEVGFLSGSGHPNALQLEFIDPRAQVKVNDRLVTYGVKGGVFAPGVPLGTVISVESEPGTSSRIAEVKPFVDVTSLDLVGVIVIKPRTDPRDILLPTATAAPTVTVTVTAGAVPTGAVTISANPNPSGTTP
jgi:rod shape-determining protein MreC